MRCYRLHRYTVADGSAGYEWFANYRTAASARADWLRDRTEGDTAEVDVIIVTQTKVGVLAALNKYAGHPDNG